MTNYFQPLLDLAAKADPLFDITRDMLLEQSLSTDYPLTFEKVDSMTIGVTSENPKTGIDKHGLTMTRLKLFEKVRYGFSQDRDYSFHGLEMNLTPGMDRVISASYSDSIYMFTPLSVGTGYNTNVMLLPGLSIIKMAVCFPYNNLYEMLDSMEQQVFENPFLSSQLALVKRLAEKSHQYPPEQAYQHLIIQVEKLSKEFSAFLD